MIFDFSQGGNLQYHNFIDQLEQIMRDQGFLKQIAFDIFDSNNDGKISHLDVYKVFHKFCQGPTEERFAEIFY